MQKTPSFMPHEPTCLEIDVITNDADETFETNLCCSRKHCGKTVVIDSDGPQTVQNVSCSKHGLLASFPHRFALGEFVRFVANKTLARNGHELIEAEALSIFGDDEPLPESSN